MLKIHIICDKINYYVNQNRAPEGFRIIDRNLSGTARRPIVRRNTSVYRFDKIQRLTGLDTGDLQRTIVSKEPMIKEYLESRERPF